MKSVKGKQHEVVVIFDRYNVNSVKTHERSRRARGIVSTEHDLQQNTPLPSREVIMKSSRNKEKLINLICQAETESRLHLIGDKQCKFGHEEADVNIIAYMLTAIQNGAKNIQITADDTDIFVLLLHFYWKHKLNVPMVMKQSNGKFIDIKVTAEALAETNLDLLSLHAISGCDSVSYPFGKEQSRHSMF